MILLYPAYWALKIRRALATRLYRNQALGLALVSVGMALLNFEADALGNPYTSPVTALFLLFAFAMIFFWTDQSVESARRSDPLVRDTLRWSKVRRALWAFNLFCIGYFLVNAAAVGVPAASQSAVFSPVVSFVLLLSFVLVAVLSAGVMLPVSSRRSGDFTLKRHLKWFGVGVLFLVIPLFVNGYPGDLGIVGLSFCTYRSAKHLAPLNRLDLDGDM